MISPTSTVDSSRPKKYLSTCDNCRTWKVRCLSSYNPALISPAPRCLLVTEENQQDEKCILCTVCQDSSVIHIGQYIWLTQSRQKRGLGCVFSPAKARKTQASRPARGRHAGHGHSRSSTIPSPTNVDAQVNDAHDSITVTTQTPTSSHARNASVSTQNIPGDQTVSESTQYRKNTDLYVDRILFAVRPTGTPEQVRSRYPAGRYSVSRQTVNEHGEHRLGGQ